MLDQKIKETQLQTRRDIDESNKSSISKHIPLMKKKREVEKIEQRNF